MKFQSNSYVLNYDLSAGQIDFEGVLRLVSPEETEELYHFLEAIHDQATGLLRLSFRRLRYINAEGVLILSRFIKYAKARDRLAIQLVGSTILAWSGHILPSLSRIWERVDYQVHDRHFYRSQDLIEDMDFIPLLRNQTRVLWPLERDMLRKHGLERGMKVADICCGCGDTSIQVLQELHASFLVGVDHSEAAMECARQLLLDSGLKNAEFQRGDATALMLPDDSFDFVLCRLSLQVFPQPELILDELIRILKPGGRVYVLSEDYDLVSAEPEADLIQDTYFRAATYAAEMGMDLLQGKKLFGMLSRYGLEEIRTDHLVVDTSNTDREALSHLVESWRQFSVFTIGSFLNLPKEAQNSLLNGYDAHLRSIRNPHGYSSWPLVACSGRKREPEERATA